MKAVKTRTWTVTFCWLMASKAKDRTESWLSWIALSRTAVVWHRLAPGYDEWEPKRRLRGRQQWGRPAGHSDQWKRNPQSAERNIKKEITIASAPWLCSSEIFDEWAQSLCICDFQKHPDLSLFCKWLGNNSLGWKYKIKKTLTKYRWKKKGSI